VGRQQQPIVGIGRGIGKHRLFGRAHPIERGANGRQMHLPTAHEAVEIKHHRLDAAVGRGGIDRPHQIAGLVFADRSLAGEEAFDRVDPLALLHHEAIEFEHERPAADIGRARPGGQNREQGAEEHQHEDEHQPVFDAHQQAPHPSRKTHIEVLSLICSTL
jgi:hypothetical protein